MGTLLDLASLVVVPSGYKEDIIYSVKPTDGSGDLDFTRSLDTATRVGPDGLIEKVRTNLFLQSETFDDAGWGKSSVTLTAGQPDPFGGNDAFLVEFGGVTGASISQSLNFVSGEQVTLSLFIKGIDLTGLRMIVAGTASVNVIGQIVNGTWVRVELTRTAGSTASLNNQIIRSENTNGESLFIYAAQLETGDIATPYIETTTAAVSVGMLANVPRLDYLGGGCPKLLLEPQRTNLVTFSEQLDNAAWTKTNTTITANALTSPDGFQNADVLVENSTSNAVYAVHRASRPSGFTLTQTFSVSFFAKKVTRDFCYYNDFNNFQIPIVFVFFNLATGIVGTAGAGVLNPKMENYGNGWYRCSFQFVASGVSGTFIDYRIASATTDNTFNYTGVIGQQAISVTNCQFEQGSFATSYIPTLGAAVTRSADAASKTGISALIGQTEGTLFVEANIATLQGAVARTLIDIGAANNRAVLQFSSVASNTMRFRIDTAAGIIRVDFRGVVTSTGTLKVAAAYKDGDCALFVNGVAGTEIANNSISFSTISDLFLGKSNTGSSLLSDGISQALLFKTRLTNTQLEELTTL